LIARIIGKEKRKQYATSTSVQLKGTSKCKKSLGSKIPTTVLHRAERKRLEIGSSAQQPQMTDGTESREKRSASSYTIESSSSG